MNHYEQTLIKELKFNIQEEKFPFFDDCQLFHILRDNNFNVKKASFICLVAKAQMDSVKLPSGLALESNREYWLTLANKYRENCGRALNRGGKDEHRSFERTGTTGNCCLSTTCKCLSPSTE